MASKKKDVVVKQDMEEEVPAQVLASAILEVSEGFKKMKRAGLTERAIVLLLHDASGVGKPMVRAVLDGLDSLERLYLMPRLKGE